MWRSVCKVNFLCRWFVSLKKHHYEEVESVQNRIHRMHFYEVRIFSPFFGAKRPVVTVCYLILLEGEEGKWWKTWQNVEWSCGYEQKERQAWEQYEFSSFLKLLSPAASNESYRHWVFHHELSDQSSTERIQLPHQEEMWQTKTVVQIGLKECLYWTTVIITFFPNIHLKPPESGHRR